MIKAISFALAAFPLASLLGCADSTPSYRDLAEQCRSLPVTRPRVYQLSSEFSEHFTGRLSPSTLIHLIRLHGRDTEWGGSTSSIPLEDLILSAPLCRQHFGFSMLEESYAGARFVFDLRTIGDPRVESHRGYALAALGSFGVGLDEVLTLEGERQCTLRAVLRDALAEFSLHQAEIDWTLQSLIAYRTGGSVWTNRFGDRCSLEDSVSEVLERPLWQASCGGAHRLELLAMVQESDDLLPFLRGPTRRRVDRFIDAAVDALVRTQGPDGSWDLSWPFGFDGAPGIPASLEVHDESRFLVTSHLAQWLSEHRCMDPRAQSVLGAATSWLATKLATQSTEQGASALCPTSHAMIACHLVIDR